MTDKAKHGGLRTPAGGRPRKDNVKWFCYLDKGIAKRIDEERGPLTRGEFITLLVAGHAIDRSNAA
jgi:hypothetical protein